MNDNATPRPKPHPPKKILEKQEVRPIEKQEVLVKEHKATAKDKPKFVLKPHLTERPFSDHEGLKALQKSLDKTPSRGQRPTRNEKK